MFCVAAWAFSFMFIFWEQMGTLQQIYSDYERGKVGIPVEILISLALLYDTSIDYLLDLTDEKIPYARKGKR